MMSRIFQRGEKRIYYIDHRVNGKRKVESLRTTIKAEAKRLQEVIDEQDRRSRYGHTIDLDMKLVDLFDRFKEYSRNNHSVSTQEDYRCYIDSVFCPYFADYTIRQFNSELMENFKNSDSARTWLPKDSRREQSLPRSNATINKMIRYLRSIIKFGKQQGIIPEEQKINNKILRTAEKRDRVLSLAEIKYIKKHGGIHTALLMTALYTGMRSSELLNLKWEQVDFDAGVIEVRNDEDFQTKNRRNRYVPIAKPLHAILTEHRKKAPRSPFVFPKADGTQLMDCRWAVKQLIDNHGMTEFSFHDLRRTFATMLAEANQDISVAKSILGHSDIRTTLQYYTRHSNESFKKAIDALQY